MLFSNNLTHDLIGIVVALLTLSIAYYKWALTYWERRGLQGLKTSFPFGNAKNLFLGKSSSGQLFKELYVELKSKGLKQGGVYLNVQPIYIPVDLEMVKRVLQIDFQHFWGHGLYINEASEPLSMHLFNLDGPRWKTSRTKFTPTFTAGKLKMMFDTLLDCTEELTKFLNRLYEKNAPIDIKDVLGRFDTDIIGSCAFGIDCNSMKEPDSEFRKYGLKAIGFDIKGSLRIMAQLILPHSFLKFINFKSLDSDISDFFLNIVKETVNYREENNIVRNDFMHLLIQMKNGQTIGDGDSKNITFNDNETDEMNKISINEIAAQSFLFFLAGFETSSTTMTFACFELAINPDIQQKVRDEINSVLEKNDDKITYDVLMELTYLEQVIYETLRKYPPLPAIFRVCSEDYKVPNTDTVVQKGTSTMVSVLGIHYDPEYYPDPETFDPERFTAENKAKRPHFAWIPFGEGPRMCLGLRFGLLQTKLGLVTLLRNYKISVNEKTEVPLVFSKQGIVLSSQGPILIDLHKIII